MLPDDWYCRGTADERSWPWTILAVAVTAIVAAAGFWLPSIALHWIHRSTFDGGDVVVITLLAPLSACAALALSLLSKHAARTLVHAIASLIAILASGPLCMLLSALATRVSSDPHVGVCAYAILFVGFPITIPMMATYDGSLIALLHVTVILLLLIVVSAMAWFLDLWGQVRLPGRRLV